MKTSGPLTESTIHDYLELLSSAEPTPGGGSAASLVASIASSLGSMVVAVGKKRGDDRRLTEIGDGLLKLRERFLGLAREDEEAFGRVLAAYRLPKGHPNRPDRIEEALQGASAVPLELAEGCLDLLRLLIDLAPLAGRQIVSDVGVAAILAKAAIDSALLNILVNASYMHDRSAIEGMERERDRISALGDELAREVYSLVVTRIR